MELRFIGQNGSMRLTFGKIYRVSVESKDDGTTMMTRPVRCPYASDNAFAQNWVDPRVELRSLMESRGRELRASHFSAEFQNTPVPDELPLWRCSRSEVHGSHNWQTLSTEKPYAWCPGKTDRE